MIRYALRCTQDHRFESWFGSSADFDRLVSAAIERGARARWMTL